MVVCIITLMGNSSIYETGTTVVELLCCLFGPLSVFLESQLRSVLSEDQQSKKTLRVCGHPVGVRIMQRKHALKMDSVKK